MEFALSILFFAILTGLWIVTVVFYFFDQRNLENFYREKFNAQRKYFESLTKINFDYITKRCQKDIE